MNGCGILVEFVLGLSQRSVRGDCPVGDTGQSRRGEAGGGNRDVRHVEAVVQFLSSEKQRRIGELGMGRVVITLIDELNSAENGKS